MSTLDLKKKINDADWTSFNGPTLYDAKVVPTALIELMELEDSAMAEEVGNRVIYALGNNHSGVYYPVVLKALDYIIDIIKQTKRKACRICALAILNDLYYFEPDVSGYNGCSADELRKFVEEKLRVYSDEDIKF